MSSDQHLVEHAQSLKTEAHRLLYGHGLLATVRAVGPAEVKGSVALDLMTWADIDLTVQLADDRDIAAFFELGRSIAVAFPVTLMTYTNEFIRPDGRFDHGLYWGIRLLFSGREWKVDLWGYGPEAYRADHQFFEDLRRRLAAVDRLALLRIKDAVRRRPEYLVNVHSMDIYAAVIDDQVRTVEEFDQWHAKQAR